ncbi:hypothetical protein TB1_007361 [Malus domestica]
MMRTEELPQCSRSPTPGLELLQPEKRLLQKHDLFKSATTTEARSRTPQLPRTVFQNPLSLWHARRVMQRCHP